MKRLLMAVFVLLILISMPSCKKRDDDRVLKNATSPFTCEVNMQYGDIVARATVNKVSAGVFDITLTQPESLAGMSFKSVDDEITVSYKGLSAQIGKDSLPAKALSKVLISTISAATEKEGVSVKEKDGVITVTGDSQSGSFTLRLDEKNGHFLSLSVPDKKFDATFENFKFT